MDGDPADGPGRIAGAEVFNNARLRHALPAGGKNLDDDQVSVLRRDLTCGSDGKLVTTAAFEGQDSAAVLPGPELADNCLGFTLRGAQGLCGVSVVAARRQARQEAITGAGGGHAARRAEDLDLGQGRIRWMIDGLDPQFAIGIDVHDFEHRDRGQGVGEPPTPALDPFDMSGVFEFAQAVTKFAALGALQGEFTRDFTGRLGIGGRP